MVDMPTSITKKSIKRDIKSAKVVTHMGTGRLPAGLGTSTSESSSKSSSKSVPASKAFDSFFSSKPEIWKPPSLASIFVLMRPSLVLG